MNIVGSFDVTSDKYNVHRICTEVINSSEKERNKTVTIFCNIFAIGSYKKIRNLVNFECVTLCS